MVRIIAPGAYCLAHLGHAVIIRKIAEDFGEVTVICSENKEKKNSRWFTPEECKEAIRAYDFGANVTIVTLAEFMKTYTPGQDIVIARGIRGDEDLEHEKNVMKENYRDYGVKKYYYIIADEKYREFSSTKARELAIEGDIEELEKMVHPKIAAMLIEKAEQIKREGIR